MDQRLQDCLGERAGDRYILPFLWLHEEPQERVREEILAIYNSGLREFCAESRPYKGFCGEQWWDDFGFILKTAKELGMRVWLLDDKQFPTGYAVGYLEKPENAHLRKRLIREFQCEAAGPMKCAKTYIGGRISDRERVIRVIAYRYTGIGESLAFDTAMDLTDRVQNGTVYWDVPAGNWRVCVTLETRAFKDEANRFFYYIDMLNPESCRSMIHAVYQPHYEHFSEYFGNTFAGFFSDEPGFLNGRGTYTNTTGIMESSYPWSDELPGLIAESAGIAKECVELMIPALWEDLGEVTATLRMHYMEVITRLYNRNFSWMLGDWCREHGVMYIGHVIEDMGAHMRMAYGSGHFFRALDGQDMAGIDIVLNQDIPGCSDHVHRAPISNGGVADPAFFRYTLPKLGASHSHIQPLKQGRAMCEIFGAFGWAEGLPFMKGLADVMLASGINRFVPHAFSPKEEDRDCPPHFYNGGRNAQYPLFGRLMDYMKRCVHVLEGARHRADVAVFYNAEGEWTGGKNQIFHEVCKHLTQNLIDFDIVPFDTLAESAVLNRQLCINGEYYEALIVSESEILPMDRLLCFKRLAEQGLPVIFTNSLPKQAAEGADITPMLPFFRAVPEDCLAEMLRAADLCHVSGKGEGLSHLRFYHVERDDKDLYLFSNEGVNEDLNAFLTLPQSGDCLIYDPWDNRCYRSQTKDGILHLCLEKGNMIFVIFGEKIPSEVPEWTVEKERKPLSLKFEIATRDEGEADYCLIAKDSALFDVSAEDHNPAFSGSIRYRTQFEAVDGFSVLDLGQVGETAEVWVNGSYLGARINAPYKFSMQGAVRPGINDLEVVVVNNPAHRRKDRFSSYIQIPPSGWLGDPALCKYEK